MSAGLAHLIPIVGVVAACLALGVSRATYYRRQRVSHPLPPRPTPPRALSSAERAEVLATLDSERFVDKAPAQVYAELLDEGVRLCSIRTMYRVLRDHDQARERRAQRRHPTYVKPQLVATKPNQVWSWDITKLAGPTRGSYYSLYVVLDIFSRFVVGWAIARTESAAVAKSIIDDACRRHGIQPGHLTVHADRGSPMVAKSTALLFADLGIQQSHSRPHVSDDNPFSEAAFRTFLYRPTMPERFGSLEHARATFADLFDWYNERHYHSGIALLTPADVHLGREQGIIAARQRVLDEAHRAHPERFVRGRPVHPTPPAVVWINPPATAANLAITDSPQRGPQREAAMPSELSAEPPRARTAPRDATCRENLPALVSAEPGRPTPEAPPTH
ncbi:MAG: IS3 family transposase [Kofleriaceae bacterium]|nr:IS3 family transposase [Kofleriaceae bacterium]